VKVRRSTTSSSQDCVERILHDVRTILQECSAQIDFPATLVLAVSGGADSLCMADAVLQLHDNLGLLPIISHLNHGLRGNQSDADAEFVNQFAHQHAVRFVSSRVNVTELSRQEHVSIEVAARKARYRFLAATAQDAGAHLVLLAHNADDQAETVLLRLIRGTGISGLAGMRPISSLAAAYAPNSPSIILVRPLLSVSRSDIELYCESRSLAPRRDSTNDDVHYLRNRVRHELLPLMERYNPGIRTVLTRLAETASSDVDIVNFAARAAYDRLLQAPSPSLEALDRKGWCMLPVGLQRAVLREGVSRVKGAITDLKFAGVEEARAVLNSSARTAEIAILSDVRILVMPDTFRFERLL
jgi:tRNA(Ile)-lysidine synthase